MASVMTKIGQAVTQLGSGLLTNAGQPAPYRYYPQQSVNVTPIGADQNAIPMAQVESQYAASAASGRMIGLTGTPNAAFPGQFSGPAAPQQYSGGNTPQYPNANLPLAGLTQAYPGYPTAPNVTPQGVAAQTSSFLGQLNVPYAGNANQLNSPLTIMSANPQSSAGPVPVDYAYGIFPDETTPQPAQQRGSIQNQNQASLASAIDPMLAAGAGTPSQQQFLAEGANVPNNEQSIVQSTSFGALGTGGIYHTPNSGQVMLPMEIAAGQSPIGGLLDNIIGHVPNQASAALPSDMVAAPTRLAQSTNPDPTARVQEQYVGLKSLQILNSGSPVQTAQSLLTSSNAFDKQAATVALQYLWATQGKGSTLPSLSGVGAAAQGTLQATAKALYQATNQPVQLGKAGALMQGLLGAATGQTPAASSSANVGMNLQTPTVSTPAPNLAAANNPYLSSFGPSAAPVTASTSSPTGVTRPTVNPSAITGLADFLSSLLPPQPIIGGASLTPAQRAYNLSLATTYAATLPQPNMVPISTPAKATVVSGPNMLTLTPISANANTPTGMQTLTPILSQAAPQTLTPISAQAQSQANLAMQTVQVLQTAAAGGYSSVNPLSVQSISQQYVQPMAPVQQLSAPQQAAVQASGNPYLQMNSGWQTLDQAMSGGGAGAGISASFSPGAGAGGDLGAGWSPSFSWGGW